MSIIFEKTKKLVNVSIVTLKRFGKRYELAIIPDKLLAYRTQKIPLSEVLHTFTIFKDVSDGTICSKDDLLPFNSDKDSIIEQILKEGTLRISTSTRNVLFKQKENEIINYLSKNLLKDNKYLTKDKIIEIVSKYNITDKDSKLQAKEIINQLEQKGYHQKEIILQVFDTTIVENSKKYGKVEKNNNSFVIKLHPKNFKLYLKYLNDKNITYNLLPSEEIEEEEIC